MPSVKHCLSDKKSVVYSLPPSAPVFQALELMKANRIRAVLIIEGGALLGIVTQGDCAIKVLLPGRSAHDTLVSEVMTRDPLTVKPAALLDQCMKVMVTRRIRHLPVLDNGVVTGVVSIGDIVKHLMQQQGEHIRYLETYIRGHAVESES